MILKCPVCRARASADAWAAEADVEAVMVILSDMPTEISRRALAYLGLFRPVSGKRPMAWATTRTHAESFKKLIDANEIKWDRGPSRANNPLAWAAAMDRAIQHPSLDLPLKDHNWLRKVAYGIAGEIERNKEVLKIQSERDGSLRNNISQNYYKTVSCQACGTMADNIVKGADCPFCGKIA